MLGKDREVVYIIHRVEDVTEFVRLNQAGSEQHRIAEELRSRAAEMEAEIFRRAHQIQELSHQLQTELEARKRAEEERNRFFTLSQDLHCTAGFDGYFKDVNPAWEKTLNYTKAELLARPYGEFIHPDDRAATQAEAGKLSGGNVLIVFENRYRCKDGSFRWLQWSATPVLEDQIIYASARDITERKRAEEAIKLSHAQLEAANKELEAFSYSVSHDRRAPLRAMDGFSRILIEKHASGLPEEAQRYLHLVRTNAQRMGQLVDDLLTFSRLNRQSLKKQLVSPASIVHQCLNELRGEQDGRRVEISIGELPACQGDPALVKRVWLNLIGNALKYTRKREVAQIEVGAQTDAQAPDVSIYFVRDNGVGFDMQYADKLFGVFQRLHRAEEYEGTGVGLAIVQRIVQRHGGRAWVEATVDQGATFYFTLEMGAAHEQQ